ncbi:unnamed protein product [Peniophora sp. CBMAI 1063]|nr:unnamed protein product [Peniophora sp. CBMAI 1063]
MALSRLLNSSTNRRLTRDSILPGPVSITTGVHWRTLLAVYEASDSPRTFKSCHQLLPRLTLGMGNSPAHINAPHPPPAYAGPPPPYLRQPFTQSYDRKTHPRPGGAGMTATSHNAPLVTSRDEYLFRDHAHSRSRLHVESYGQLGPEEYRGRAGPTNPDHSLDRVDLDAPFPSLAWSPVGRNTRR